MLAGKRRVGVDAAKQVDGTGGLEPVAILSGDVAREAVLAILEMKSQHTDGLYVAVYDGGTTHDAQNNVRGGVVAEGDGQAEKFAEGNVDFGFGIFVLQRTVGVVEEAVAGEEPDGLVERKFTLFHEMKGCKGQRGFEDGLHGRMCVRIEIAV